MRDRNSIVGQCLLGSVCIRQVYAIEALAFDSRDYTYCAFLSAAASAEAPPPEAPSLLPLCCCDSDGS